MFRLLIFATAMLASGVRTPAVAAVAADRGPHFEVRIYSDFQVHAEAMRQALHVAKAVLQQARLGIRWFDCTAAPESEDCAYRSGDSILNVHLTKTRTSLKSANVHQLGVTLMAPGAPPIFAKIFANQVEDLASRAHTPVNHLLGYAIAHEVGHLILQSPDHAAFGVMKARWGSADAVFIRRVSLTFDSASVHEMRRRWQRLRDAKSSTMPGPVEAQARMTAANRSDLTRSDSARSGLTLEAARRER